MQAMLQTRILKTSVCNQHVAVKDTMLFPQIWSFICCKMAKPKHL